MKHFLKHLMIITTLLAMLMTANCFAGIESEALDEEDGWIDILPIDITSEQGSINAESSVIGKDYPIDEDHGFFISKDSPHYISLYDCTTRLQVYYPAQYATGEKVLWTSSNEEVLLVTEDGRLIPLQKGRATITAFTGEPEEHLYDKIDITVLDIYAQANDPIVTVSPGESAVLQVRYSIAPGRSAQFNWYIKDYEKGEYVPLANSWSSFLVLENVTETLSLYCEVCDGTCPGGVRVDFLVWLSNLDLSYPGGEADRKGVIYADQDGNAALVVDVAAKDPDTLFYFWENRDGSPAEGGSNSNTLEVTGITEETVFYCMVFDEYGNSWMTAFTVRPYGTEPETEDLFWEDDGIPVIRLE